MDKCEVTVSVDSNLFLDMIAQYYKKKLDEEIEEKKRLEHEKRKKLKIKRNSKRTVYKQSNISKITKSFTEKIFADQYYENFQIFFGIMLTSFDENPKEYLTSGNSGICFSKFQINILNYLIIF